jgi:hypothetical protein
MYCKFQIRQINIKRGIGLRRSRIIYKENDPYVDELAKEVIS